MAGRIDEEAIDKNAYTQASKRGEQKDGRAHGGTSSKDSVRPILEPVARTQQLFHFRNECGTRGCRKGATVLGTQAGFVEPYFVH